MLKRPENNTLGFQTKPCELRLADNTEDHSPSAEYQVAGKDGNPELGGFANSCT